MQNKNGDILFQRSFETREKVGIANVYLDKKYSNFWWICYKGEKIGEYIPIKTNLARNKITSKSGGSTRYNVGQEILKDIKLLFPSLQEQEKIANFLSAIDEKIEKIENSLNELKEFKKGLLQEMFV